MLANVIDYYFYLNGKIDSVEKKFIPDGKTDMIFTFEGNYGLTLNETKIGSTKSGYLTYNISSSISAYMDGNIEMIGVRFLPYGFYSVFGIPALEIANNIIEADLILGKKFRMVKEELYNIQNINERFDIIERWLIGKFVNVSRKDEELQYSIKMINNQKGILNINQFYGNFESEYKKIQRKFNTFVGVSPKLYTRMVRFEAIHNYILHKKNIDWMELVVKFSLHDQSHLIKEFKYFTGLSPNDFIKNIAVFV